MAPSQRHRRRNRWLPQFLSRSSTFLAHVVAVRVALVDVVALLVALAPAVAVVLPLATIDNPHLLYLLNYLWECN